MYSSYLLNHQSLQPGDVVITPKSFANLVEHYIVFIGNFQGVNWYIDNNNVFGVRWLDERTLINENPTYLRIRRMKNDHYSRMGAVQRAKSMIGTEYSLANFNCEHFANYVQGYTSYSKQVNNTAGIALFALAILFIGGVASSSSE